MGSCKENKEKLTRKPQRARNPKNLCWGLERFGDSKRKRIIRGGHARYAKPLALGWVRYRELRESRDESGAVGRLGEFGGSSREV
jgi:hypothetical protein